VKRLNEVTLYSTKLQLRIIKPTDNKDIFALRSNPEINKYLPRNPAKSISEASQFIQNILTSISSGSTFYWAICFREDPRLLGTICLWNISSDRATAEIGFELLPKYQGVGIMKEATAIVLKFAFEKLRLKSVVAITHVDNNTSISLLKRNHFIKSEPQPRSLEKNEVEYVLSAGIFS